MKKIFLLAACFVALAAQAQIKSATLEASGLTCAMCSKAVYNALSAVPFVEKVSPDIERSTYELQFRSGSDIDPDLLSKAVSDAGFSVSMLKVRLAFSGQKVANDTHLVLGDRQFHFLNVEPQILNGTKTLTLLDKNFVSAKQFKKFSKLTAMNCFESGKMDGRRIFHVTI